MRLYSALNAQSGRGPADEAERLKPQGWLMSVCSAAQLVVAELQAGELSSCAGGRLCQVWLAH